MLTIEELPEGFDNPAEMLKEAMECNFPGKEWGVSTIQEWNEGWDKEIEFFVKVEGSTNKFIVVTAFANGWSIDELGVS